MFMSSLSVSKSVFFYLLYLYNIEFKKEVQSMEIKYRKYRSHEFLKKKKTWRKVGLKLLKLSDKQSKN